MERGALHPAIRRGVADPQRRAELSRRWRRIPRHNQAVHREHRDRIAARRFAWVRSARNYPYGVEMMMAAT